MSKLFKFDALSSLNLQVSGLFLGQLFLITKSKIKIINSNEFGFGFVLHCPLIFDIANKNGIYMYQNYILYTICGYKGSGFPRHSTYVHLEWTLSLRTQCT